MTAAFAAVPVLLALAGSPASVGTGIQAGPVCLPVTAHPGGSYALPPVTVQDTGSGGESISLTVQKYPPGGLPGHQVPASWVKFTYPRGWWGMTAGSSVHLGSGATAKVPARLTVPSSAAPGPYVAWLVAGPAGNAVPGQANFGGEAIADLEFTVAGPGVSRHVTCVVPGAKQAKAPKVAHLTGHAGHHHHKHQHHAAAAAASWSPTDPANRVPLLLALIGMFVTFLLLRPRRAS